MPPNTSKRVPVSCENCRKRKIRCFGTGIPCDTCVKRGFASSCQFKRDVYPSSQAQATLQHSLVERISHLESLLEQNIALTSATLPGHETRNLPSPQSDSNGSGVFGDDTTPTASHDASAGSSSSTANNLLSSGTLLTSPSGHVRYLPFSTAPDSALIDMIQEPAQGLASPNGFPFFSSESLLARQSLLDSLPPSRQCDELHSIFLAVFSPLFHVLHDPTFESKYADFKNDAQSAPLSFLALLFVTLALAVTALDEEHPLLMDLGREATPTANIRSLASKYRAAAMRCLAADNFLWQHSLETAQALVLLIYAINHANGPAWSLLGTTLNIAVAIGCHVDPAMLNVGPIEAEERRRCWAALMMLHTIQNTCLGNLTPFKIQSAIAMPEDIDDDDLLTGASVHHHPGSGYSSPRPLTKMSYILFKFRLYNLAFDICQLVSSGSAPEESLVRRLDEQIANEQQSHAARFYPREQLPTYHLAHSYILSNYTSHLILLLHRPCLNLPYEPPHSQAATTHSSYSRCEHAALTILSNFDMLHTNPDFKPYQWYIYGLGSFHAFFAVTTLLVLLGRGGLSPESTEHTTHILRTCLLRFHQTAARSEISAKASSILRPLMDDLIAKAPLPMTSPAIAAAGADSSGESGHSGATREALEFDLNGWTVPEHLENMMSVIPCEQWLSPAGFPWAGMCQES
ncbi:fungal-specific transcription factor domain-containing protein [Diplogelasinospora grovesii]|uniref:Fungal-specific transcription factor domain-containing protein n=1 Tax=Diplogelasinospora grovesii TaxID=303347 RepID=A0AAN6RZT1_9PEZI|nr:fungal-specific transcription factor domain-containing protein [Diplogelasinospora grovesii]